MPVVVYDPDECGRRRSRRSPLKTAWIAPTAEDVDGFRLRSPASATEPKKATDPRVAGEGTCSEPVSAVEQDGSSVGVVMRSNAIPPKQRKPTHRRAATKALTAGREVSGSLLARTLIDRAG